MKAIAPRDREDQRKAGDTSKNNGRSNNVKVGVRFYPSNALAKYLKDGAV